MDRVRGRGGVEGETGCEAEKVEWEAGAALTVDHDSQVPEAVAGKARAVAEKVTVVVARATAVRGAAARAAEALVAAARAEAALGTVAPVVAAWAMVVAVRVVVGWEVATAAAATAAGREARV